MYNLIYQSFLNEVLDLCTVKITNKYIHDFRNSVVLLLAWQISSLGSFFFSQWGLEDILVSEFLKTGNSVSFIVGE